MEFLNQSKPDITVHKIDKKHPVVYLFYAEWCGHCQSLRPIWDDIENNIKKNYKHSIQETKGKNIQILKNNNIVLEIVQVNSDDQKNYLQENFIKFDERNVQGYPTILKIKNNKIEFYKGAREFQSIKDWILSDVGYKKKDIGYKKKDIGYKKKGYKIRKGGSTIRKRKGGCGCGTRKKGWLW